MVRLLLGDRRDQESLRSRARSGRVERRHGLCAVAANLGAIGLGEDTGGSARLPASFDNLVGLKVTPGLISRAGMSPLVIFQDSAGPMCRTVTDTAKLLQVVAGYDPDDPYTATAVIAGKTDYVACLDRDALARAGPSASCARPSAIRPIPMRRWSMR